MAEFSINGSSIGTALQTLLMVDDIQPGSDIGYQTAKTILAYHPLGQKMAEAPVKMAQSQKRKIAVPDAPEDRAVEAFEKEWLAIGATKHIRNVMKLSRAYGVASLAIVEDGIDTTEPLDFDKLASATIGFNAFDPLNTAGSLVLNQDTAAIDFQKTTEIRSGGKTYHRSRTVVVLNEEPIYLEYTSSAYGYVGRSVYQRALYPLKSFLQTMITDDLITLKSGVLIAKVAQTGSIVSNVMGKIGAQKRQFVKEAQTGNVLQITPEESIETLDLHNLEGAYGIARTNILKNIATSADMPAKLLENETMVSGFGEGAEDAKNIARYIDDVREEMDPLYSFFDKIVMHRAWNEDFYKTIQNDFPEQYGKMDYKTAFIKWSNSFKAEWPNLLVEPDSEVAKSDDIKLKAMISTVEVLAPMLDPENKVRIVSWMQDNLNAMKLLFSTPLDIDVDALESYTPPLEQEPREEAVPDNVRRLQV